MSNPERWADVAAAMRKVRAHRAATLVDGLATRWEGRVDLRTSMWTPFFTVPGQEFPFPDEVWTDVSTESAVELHTLWRVDGLVISDWVRSRDALVDLDWMLEGLFVPESQLESWRGGSPWAISAWDGVALRLQEDQARWTTPARRVLAALRSQWEHSVTPSLPRFEGGLDLVPVGMDPTLLPRSFVRLEWREHTVDVTTSTAGRSVTRAARGDALSRELHRSLSELTRT